MKYKRIVRTNTSMNDHVGHTTIRGLKLAIRQGKVKEGEFICYTPSGTRHWWTISQSSVHTCAGSTGAKGKIGKGVTRNNYAAKLIEVVAA